MSPETERDVLHELSAEIKVAANTKVSRELRSIFLKRCFMLLQFYAGTIDLCIASIAISRNFTVLTRNTTNSEKVPGPKVEDWTL